MYGEKLNGFWGEETVTDEEREGWPEKLNGWKHCQNASNCVFKSLCKIYSRPSEHQGNCVENVNWKPWNVQDVCQNGPKEANRLTNAEVAWTVHRPVREARWYFRENMMKSASSCKTLKQSNKFEITWFSVIEHFCQSKFKT